MLKNGLEIYKLHVQKDDILIRWILRILGNAYLASGNYKESQKLLEQCLTISKKHFPETHPDIHMVLLDLGLIYSKLGEHKRAITMLETSLKGYEGHYGKGHIETATALRNLGQAYFAQGNDTVAVKRLKVALAIFEAHKHPERYICLEALSGLYLKKANEVNKEESQKLKEKAHTYLQQALDIVKAHFPEDSPHLKRIEQKFKAFAKDEEPLSFKLH